MTALPLFVLSAALGFAWGQADQPSLQDFLSSSAKSRGDQLFRIQDRPLDGDELAYLRSSGYDLTPEGLVLDPVEHKPLSAAQADDVLRLAPNHRRSQTLQARRTLNEIDYLALSDRASLPASSNWEKRLQSLFPGSPVSRERARFLALVRELDSIKNGDPDAADRLRALLDAPGQPATGLPALGRSHDPAAERERQFYSRQEELIREGWQP